jgi:hypothetical protein
MMLLCALFHLLPNTLFTYRALRTCRKSWTTAQMLFTLPHSVPMYKRVCSQLVRGSRICGVASGAESAPCVGGAGSDDGHGTCGAKTMQCNAGICARVSIADMVYTRESAR